MTEQPRSAYAELHLADWVPDHYDSVIYAPGSFDDFVWQALELPLLRRTASCIPRGERPLRFLDFACGTGRVLAALEELSDEATGVDISPHMLRAAATHVRKASLRAGDLLTEPELASGAFDLITAFRFFLNTEPEMRERVMPLLASRLAGGDSRLVFNIHINRWHMLASRIVRHFRGLGQIHALAPAAGASLAARAGLTVERVYGFGILPDRFYWHPVVGAMARRIDRIMAGRTPLKWFCRDLVYVCRRAEAN